MWRISIESLTLKTIIKQINVKYWSHGVTFILYILHNVNPRLHWRYIWTIFGFFLLGMPIIQPFNNILSHFFFLLIILIGGPSRQLYVIYNPALEIFKGQKRFLIKGTFWLLGAEKVWLPKLATLITLKREGGKKTLVAAMHEN